MSVQEPTKKDVLSIADYLGCNGEELWSEVSKLLLRQDNYARIDELERLYLVYGSPEQPATLDNVFILGEKGKTATLPVKDRLTQLSTELTNKEMK